MGAGEKVGKAALREKFYLSVRESLFGGTIKPKQFEGLKTILDEWDKTGLTDPRWLAYILATIFHETGKKMQPVKEFGGDKYLQSKPYYPYYGRDLCQTTWLYNYKKVKAFSGIDVVSNPELIGQMPLAAKVAIEFMYRGWYTGKKLSDYFNEKTDWKSARRVINGTDKADLIAGYGRLFYSALT